MGRSNFSVLRKLTGNVEIRRYEPYLIAETTVDGTSGFQEAGRKGFGVCAGYIFGKNRARTALPRLPGWITTPSDDEKKADSVKMAMTAPVRLDGTQGKNKKKVSFVLGSNYTVGTAPIPLDGRKIRIRQVPCHTLAVVTFAGPPPTDEKVQKKREFLQKTLVDAGIDCSPSNVGIEKDTLVYGYHDPFITPNILRRNEVALVLKGQV